MTVGSISTYAGRGQKSAKARDEYRLILLYGIRCDEHVFFQFTTLACVAADAVQTKDCKEQRYVTRYTNCIQLTLPNKQDQAESEIK